MADYVSPRRLVKAQAFARISPLTRLPPDTMIGGNSSPTDLAMLCLIGNSFGGLDLTFFLAYLAVTLVIGFLGRPAGEGHRERLLSSGESAALVCNRLFDYRGWHQFGAVRG